MLSRAAGPEACTSTFFTKHATFWTPQLTEPLETSSDLTPCLVEHVGFARYYFAKKLEVKLGSVYPARRKSWVQSPVQPNMPTHQDRTRKLGLEKKSV